MDAISVVSSVSVNRNIDFHHTKPSGSKASSGMVQKKWQGGDTRRMSYERSEVSTCTDLSAERPNTRDTTSLLMRDASVLSGQPDKSNFREKMQSWAVYEDSSSPYLAPRPTTSLDQKATGLMNDIDREMSFLMSRPSTTFPSKPKELVEPLEGIMPDERPVSQKKFFVLPSIGHRHASDFLLRRQRSNLETVNQLDFSRNELEDGVHFFSEYYQNNPQLGHRWHKQQYSEQAMLSPSPQHKQKQRYSRSPHQQIFSDDEDSELEDHVQYDPPHFVNDPRESPTKTGKIGTPMPLPPIHKMKWERVRAHAGLTELVEENAQYSRDPSRLTSDTSSEDEDDLEEFRLKTPETFRTESPTKPLTPPPGFR